MLHTDKLSSRTNRVAGTRKPRVLRVAMLGAATVVAGVSMAVVFTEPRVTPRLAAAPAAVAATSATQSVYLVSPDITGEEQTVFKVFGQSQFLATSDRQLPPIAPTAALTRSDVAGSLSPIAERGPSPQPTQDLAQLAEAAKSARIKADQKTATLTLAAMLAKAQLTQQLNARVAQITPTIATTAIGTPDTEANPDTAATPAAPIVVASLETGIGIAPTGGLSADRAPAVADTSPEIAPIPPKKRPGAIVRDTPAKPEKPAVAEKPAVVAKPANSGTSARATLAYAPTDRPDDEDTGLFSGLGKVFNTGKTGLPGPRSKIAVYDISSATVHMPDGQKLEAHSGIGHMKDNPKYVHKRNAGPTPPNVYKLRMRERLFHGVEAIRMLPTDTSAMHGRDGMLTHTQLLRRTNGSHGCVAFKDYSKFLRAFKAGKIDTLIVVPTMDKLPTYMASL